MIKPITKNIIIINILFYFAQFVFQTKGMDISYYLGAFPPLSINFNYYQIITHMFLHSNISHLLFNMISLWMFGNVLEKILGFKKYIILFICSGLFGYILYSIYIYIQILNITGSFTYIYNIPFNKYSIINSILNTNVIGSSAAIYGLLLSFTVMYPNEKIMLIFFPFPIKAKYFIPVMLFLEVFLGIMQVGNISYFSHIGGGICGFLLTKYWIHKNKI